jgi:hypothetical protein
MSEASTKVPSPYEPRSTLLGSIVRNVFTLFFLAVAVMCVYNVFGVGGEVEAMAKELACTGQPMPCTAQYTMASRSPWAHNFKMYTSAKSGEMDISCMREYIFVGDYSCKSKNGAIVADAAGSSSKTAPSASGLGRTPQKVKVPVPARPAASAGTP